MQVDKLVVVGTMFFQEEPLQCLGIHWGVQPVFQQRIGQTKVKMLVQSAWRPKVNWKKIRAQQPQDYETSQSLELVPSYMHTKEEKWPRKPLKQNLVHYRWFEDFCNRTARTLYGTLCTVSEYSGPVKSYTQLWMHPCAFKWPPISLAWKHTKIAIWREGGKLVIL